MEPRPWSVDIGHTGDVTAGGDAVLDGPSSVPSFVVGPDLHASAAGTHGGHGRFDVDAHSPFTSSCLVKERTFKSLVFTEGSKGRCLTAPNINSVNEFHKTRGVGTVIVERTLVRSHVTLTETVRGTGAGPDTTRYDV